MNNFFGKAKRKETSLGELAPKFDPYGIWKKKEDFFGVKKDMQTVMPGVTFWEERRLETIQDYIKKETSSETCNVPMHMLNDVYSMYMNKDFKIASDKSHTVLKKKVIEKTYNSLTKILTEDSPLFSQMITREIGVYLQEVESKMSEEMEKQGKTKGAGESAFDQEIGEDESEGDQPAGGKNATSGTNGKGHGEWSKEDSEMMNKVDEILNNSTESLDKALKNAQDKIKDLEDKLGKEAMKDLANSDPDFLEKVDTIKNALSNVSINKESVKNILAKILNKSQNYFSNKSVTVEESIFESEELEDLFGLEYLHPIFRNAGLLDIGNEGKIYNGKIDLYLDCSGSMGSKESFGGVNIRMSDLVKGIAMVLFRMNMIDKLYFFDGSIYEIKKINEFTILGFNKSGGTNFDNVIDQCNANGRNSVVITDGEDRCSKYSSNVFFVGVGGTRFGSYGENSSFEMFKKTGQCVTYVSSKNTFEYVKT